MAPTAGSPSTDVPTVERVVVVGSGTMGAGIGQACAQAGHPTTLVDIDQEALDRAVDGIRSGLEGLVEKGKKDRAEVDTVLDRLSTTTDLAAAASEADLVIEAVFEEMKVKEDVFAQVAGAVDEGTVVATNTSSLSVTDLGEAFGDPSRFAGLHFFYPAMINRLVEVVPGEGTDPAVLAALTDVAHGLGKVPIRTADAAGFAVNRFFVPFLNEACRIHADGVAIPTIEAAAKDRLGIGMGPFELMNVTGIPIAFHAQTTLFEAFGEAYAVAPLLKEQFEAGEDWDLGSDDDVEEDRLEAVGDRLLGLLFGVASQLVEEGVATAEATDVGAAVGLRWKQGPFALMNELGTARALELVEAYADEHATGDFDVAANLQEQGASDEPWPLRQAVFEKDEHDARLGWVHVQRPAQLNALNSQVLEDLEAAFREAAADEDVRVVGFTGAGKAFIAGADIRQMRETSPIDNRDYTELGQRVTTLIESVEKPVIAAVNGYALGGGLEMALACDLLVFSDKAVVGLPEVGLGIVPGFGGTQRLTRLVGRARAKEVVFTGRHFDADAVERLGLPNRVVPHARLRATVRGLADEIAANAPKAVALSKALINKGTEAPLDAGLELEKEAISLLFSTEDKEEGMDAFLERRKPKFEGK